MFIISDHLKYLDVDFTIAVLECNTGLNLNGGNTPSNTTKNETFGETLKIILNWTDYESILYTSSEISDSYGLQTLIEYSLKEAAVTVRYDLTDDSQILADIVNVSNIEEDSNETILINMDVSFYKEQQWTGFECDLSYILDEFNVALKSALSMVNESVILLSEDTEGVSDGSSATDSSETNTGCSCDNSGVNEEQENDNDDDSGTINIGVIIFVCALVFLVIVAVVLYVKQRNNAMVKPGSKNQELSGKDQMQENQWRVTSLTPQ